MLKHFLYPILFHLPAIPVFAHPGIGIVMSSRGEVFYADLKQVWKISPARVEVTTRSSAPWGPTGGLLAPNDDLWLLEYSDYNTTRVRQIRGDGTEKVY